MKRWNGRSDGFRSVFRVITDSGQKGWISPHDCVVVEVFVAERDSEDSLGQHGLLIMLDSGGGTWIRNGLVHGFDQAGLLLDFAKQQYAGVRSNTSAVEIGFDFFGAMAGK